MKKCDKKYLISLLLLLLGIILIILGFCLKLDLRELNFILVIFGIIISLFGIYNIGYNIEINSQNDDYINDIIMYRKGYTLELRLPKTVIEDRLFRENADENMIKELDRYLEYNKSVKIINNGYNDYTIEKLTRKDN